MEPITHTVTGTCLSSSVTSGSPPCPAQRSEIGTRPLELALDFLQARGHLFALLWQLCTQRFRPGLCSQPGAELPGIRRIIMA